MWLCIADDPDARLRDIAASVGITERAAHRIVDEVVEGLCQADAKGKAQPSRGEAPASASRPRERDRKVPELLGLFARECVGLAG